MLLEQIEPNQYAIKLQDGKQPLYGVIYSLRLMDLKTLKTYIKSNLANSFIWPSNSTTGAPILFVQKLNSSFYLCVDY